MDINIIISFLLLATGIDFICLSLQDFITDARCIPPRFSDNS